MNRLVKATGGQIQTTVHGLTPDVLGFCGEFEEVQIGAERYNLFKKCSNVTLIDPIYSLKMLI